MNGNLKPLRSMGNDILILMWNKYNDITNNYECDYYPMQELEERLKSTDDFDDQWKDCLADNFDKTMKYFTENSKGEIISVNSLSDDEIQILYDYLTN